MRKSLLLVPLLLAACSPEGPAEMGMLEPTQALASRGQARNFTVPLSWREEVPPAIPSRATGVAQFRLSPDGSQMTYRLIVANVENVTMAHIHLAPAGANGPVVVWLYPESPPPQLIPGRFNGVLAEGVITEANLVGLLANKSLSDLVEEMVSGNAYVNVHTSQFPGGEIRGQI